MGTMIHNPSCDEVLGEMTAELTEHPDLRREEEYLSYRAINTLSVVALGMGILSIMAFLGWVLGAFGVLGILLGLLAVWRIRQRPEELTGLPFAWTGVVLSAVFLPAGWGWLAFEYFTEVPEGYLRISYDDFRPGKEEFQTLPSQRAKELDGTKIFIKGYIYPSSTSRPRQFILCRDNGDCCFGGQPAMTDMVLVTVGESLRPTFSTYQRKLGGVLRLKVTDDGEVGVIVYHLEADYMK